jgi:hypothetical protein
MADTDEKAKVRTALKIMIRDVVTVCSSLKAEVILCLQ